MDKIEGESLWVEAYRPKRISDCILTEEHRKYFSSLVAKKEIQNMILCGSAGMGKSTVAMALCEEMNLDYMFINGSKESGIDILRTKITQFATTISMKSDIKVVIIDEADHLTPSFQAAFRSFIEEYSSSCRFILTANFKDKIIPALHSRCRVKEFKIPKDERKMIASYFFVRILSILNNENVKYKDDVIAKVVQKHFPDFRKTLDEIQGHALASDNVIDESILVSLENDTIKQLIDHLRDKEWKKMRQWVANNIDQDSVSILRALYDNLIPLTDQCPQLVLILADYQYKSSFAADQEINLVACMTEIMASVDIK